jgi:hypothetical protein
MLSKLITIDVLHVLKSGFLLPHAAVIKDIPCFLFSHFLTFLVIFNFRFDLIGKRKENCCYWWGLYWHGGGCSSLQLES